MEPATSLDNVNAKFTAALSHLDDELNKLRTGRAHSGMLDGVMVEAYGTPMPLIQVASIAVPEPQLLQLTPFDPNNLPAISQAIRDNQSLGLNPADDGRVIRIQIPALTEERRREIVKQLGVKVEDCMIRLRNIRHEAKEEAEKAKKAKEIGDDDYNRFIKQLDEAMQKQKHLVEERAHQKETEIMTV